MIVENTCRKCGHHYDGHWHRLPPGVPSWETVPCPECGEKKNIYSWNDESESQPEYAGNIEDWDFDEEESDE